MKSYWAKRCSTIALGAVLGLWAVPAHADNDVGCGIGTWATEPGASQFGFGQGHLQPTDAMCTFIRDKSRRVRVPRRGAG